MRIKDVLQKSKERSLEKWGIALAIFLAALVAPQAFSAFDFENVQAQAAAPAVAENFTPTPTPNGTPLAYPTDALRRLGVGFDGWDYDHKIYPGDSLDKYDLSQVFGPVPTGGYPQGYYDFTYRTEQAPGTGEIHYLYHMILGDLPVEKIMLMIKNNPTTWIVIGNEADRQGQTSLTPEKLAVWYHTMVTKIEDAKQQLLEQDGVEYPVKYAVAPIAQPSPLRLLYLDKVVAAYRQLYGVDLPASFFDTHGYILPENCNWGLGAPPGMDAETQALGVPCISLDEHGNVDTFKARIVALRQWMKNNGYQDMPLVVSEYGILLSKYHGWTPERVSEYLVQTTTYMLTATDQEIGNPADGYRLVQGMDWFSLNFAQFDITTGQGLNGGLFDKETKQRTEIGAAYAAMVRNIMLQLAVTPTPQPTPEQTATFIATAPGNQTPESTGTATPTPTVTATATVTGTVDIETATPTEGGTPTPVGQPIKEYVPAVFSQN